MPRVRFACLLALPAAARGLVTLSDPHVDQVHSVPKLHGHTSNVHPFNANSDREWYVEARWAKGKAHKPQDGEITVQPEHVPVPKPVQREATSSSPKMLSGNTGYKGKTKDSKSSKKSKEGKAKKAGVEKLEADVEEVEEVDTAKVSITDENADLEELKEKPHTVGKVASDADEKDAKDKKDKKESKAKYTRPKQNLRNYHPKKEEKSYALPKPDGHTSLVHPTKGNTDREWYTENRWKKGREYKPQDGVITELPKHA